MAFGSDRVEGLLKTCRPVQTPARQASVVPPRYEVSTETDGTLPSQVAEPLRGSAQLVAEGGRGDGDERGRALADGPAAQLGDAVLRHDLVDHVPVRGDGDPWGERRLDAGDRPFTAVACVTMNDCPPSDSAAPRMKSACPPEPVM